MTEKNESKDEMDIDFELPDVTDGAKVTPRVHVAPGESACTSCEG